MSSDPPMGTQYQRLNAQGKMKRRQPELPPSLALVLEKALSIQQGQAVVRESGRVTYYKNNNKLKYYLKTIYMHDEEEKETGGAEVRG